MQSERNQRLKLAFLIEQVARVVAADGEQSHAEFKMVGQIFPRPLLRDAGFLDEDDLLTDEWRRAKDQATEVLASEATEAEREDMMALLYGACAVDELEERELVVLREAAMILGYSEPAAHDLLVRLGQSD